MTGAIIIASTFAARLSARLGPGPILALGMTLIGIGMLLFTGISAQGSYVSDVLLAGVVTTTGLGLSFVPVTIAAVAGVQRAEAGLASGLVNTSRQVGGSLGLAALATIATQRTSDLAGAGGIDANALVGGYQRAFVVGSMFAFAGALIALVGLVRVRHPQQQTQRQAPAPVDA
jgi:MFS family permease